MPNQAQLRLENVHKEYYYAGTTTSVLNNISVAFDSGTSYAITGPSGSGKSTLLNLLAGIDAPSSGTVFFNTTDINQLNPAQRSHFLAFSIGLVFQNPHLLHDLSIQENVMLPGLIAGLSRQECMSRSLDLLRQVDIAHKAHDKPANLSGGQQQRVALARALFNRPSFLLADEPTGNLDPKTALQIVELLLTCANEWNMGLIISTHDQMLANRMNKTYKLNQSLFI